MKAATRQAVTMLLQADGSIPADRLAAAFDVLSGRAGVNGASAAPASEWLTCREACEFLRCSRTLLWRLEKEGRIAGSLLGSKKLYNRAALVAAVLEKP